jgi:hypothetical protein
LETLFTSLLKILLLVEKKLSSLKNFYLAGQWVEPGGGVNTASLTSKTFLFVDGMIDVDVSLVLDAIVI